ncbi:group II intron maturase-specific domain-containing protein [Paenibacillus sp. NPDC055715]
MRTRIKKLTARSNWNEEWASRLRRYIKGWINYFKITDMKKLLQRRMSG